MLNKMKAKMGITMATTMIEKVAVNALEKGELYQEVELPFAEPDFGEAKGNEDLIMTVIRGVYDKLSKKPLYHGISILIYDVNGMIPEAVSRPILDEISDGPVSLVMVHMAEYDGSPMSVESVNERVAQLRSGKRRVIITLNAARRDKRFRRADFSYPVVNIKFK